MARRRLDLLGAILLVVASLWLAPGSVGARLALGTGASEAEDVLSPRTAQVGHLLLAEGLSDETDDDGLGLDDRNAAVRAMTAGGLQASAAILVPHRRGPPRATGPPA